MHRYSLKLITEFSQVSYVLRMVGITYKGKEWHLNKLGAVSLAFALRIQIKPVHKLVKEQVVDVLG